MINIDKTKLTPMMKQYFEIKEKYMDYILFYRLGDFYEMFFEDAVKASKALEITLTGRNCGLPEKAPLCGIPYHSANNYLSRLIDKGFKVAVCEQIEDPATAKGIVKRDVVRVLTPGTVIDPEMLDEGSNNYILSIYEGENAYGIAYSDITTGELRTTSLPKDKTSSKLLDEIIKISPTEIITQVSALDVLDSPLLDDKTVQSKVPDSFFKQDNSERIIQRLLNVFSSDSLGFDGCTELICATGGLLAYIEETQKVKLAHISAVDIYSIDNFMILDKFTRRNLELTETIRSKDKKGSLLWVLDRTKTSMGARELKKIIEQPLLNHNVIKKRLDAVEILHDDLFLRDEMRNLLSEVYDLERLSTKLVYGNVNGRDLVALKNSLTVLPSMKNLLRDFKDGLLQDIDSDMDALEDICSLIETSIADEPPITIREGGIIRDGYDEELDNLRNAVKNGKQWIFDIESREKERTGIKTLKIGFNKVFGYYIDVTRANSSSVPADYIRKQTLANSERYITPELKEIEEKVLGAEDKIVDLEYRLFSELRERLLDNVARFLRTAKSVSMLDVLCSFAQVSYSNGYIKPKVSPGKNIKIEEGRHPVIERIGSNEKFVPNNTVLDDSENRMYIITGPNMAGKSTYLRQVALITLMAQIGCYVPAQSADIGITDRIFTRVGASDDLSQGQSTFMVEMSELANILHNSTSDSLIILDEIGRGTSTYDGLSIAWAVVEYLSQDEEFSPKTMFATHYHELTELEGKFNGVKNYRISVEEVGDDIVFLRKIVRGSASQSYGIQVAKLAGVPDKVLDIANDVLRRLEANDINKNINNIMIDHEKYRDHTDNIHSNDINNANHNTSTDMPLNILENLSEEHDYKVESAIFEDVEIKSTKKKNDNNENQISFFGRNPHDDIIEELKSINVYEMTPMESMNKLFELVKKLK